MITILNKARFYNTKYHLLWYVSYTAALALAYEAGRQTKRLQRFWPAASWKTPNFTGNSGRSPIYPYIPMPFYEDHE